jgi:hypothetical protein
VSPHTEEWAAETDGPGEKKVVIFCGAVRSKLPFLNQGVKKISRFGPQPSCKTVVPAMPSTAERRRQRRRGNRETEGKPVRVWTPRSEKTKKRRENTVLRTKKGMKQQVEQAFEQREKDSEQIKSDSEKIKELMADLEQTKKQHEDERRTHEETKEELETLREDGRQLFETLQRRVDWFRALKFQNGDRVIQWPTDEEIDNGTVKVPY